jgi:hypothetical protein
MCTVCTVFLYCFVYVYVFLLVLSVLAPSDNPISVNNKNNNNNNNKRGKFVHDDDNEINRVRRHLAPHVLKFMPRPLYSVKKNSGAHWIAGCVGPRAGLDVLENEMFSLTYRISKPGLTARRLVTILPELPQNWFWRSLEQGILFSLQGFENQTVSPYTSHYTTWATLAPASPLYEGKFICHSNPGARVPGIQSIDGWLGPTAVLNKVAKI